MHLDALVSGVPTMITTGARLGLDVHHILIHTRHAVRAGIIGTL